MYFYASLFFCWLLQYVHASSKLRQVSNVPTRSHLVSRMYRGGSRNYGLDQAANPGGSNRWSYHVDGNSNSDPDFEGLDDPQTGNLFHWRDAGFMPKYDIRPPQEIVPSSPIGEPNNIPMRFPPEVTSQLMRPPVIEKPNTGAGTETQKLATYKTERTKMLKRRAQKLYMERKANTLKYLEGDLAESKAKIARLEKSIGRIEGFALQGWISDNPSGFSGLIIAEINDLRAMQSDSPGGIEVPVGEPRGGSYSSTSDAMIFERSWEQFPPGIYRSRGYNSYGHDTSLRIGRRSSPPPNQPSDPIAEFNFYVDVYTQLRTNVSELLFPYFSTILRTTNSSSIYELVRSVFSDLVAAGPWTIGPYSNGQHCFDWIENQLFGNITDDAAMQNETIIGVLANHDMLIEIYDNVWGNATQIANQTGYLEQMSTVRRFLNPVNKSIIPDTWKVPQPLPRALSFDALYNKTLLR